MLSEPLQKFLGEKTLPRTQVVKRLWDYIKLHNLQVLSEGICLKWAVHTIKGFVLNGLSIGLMRSVKLHVKLRLMLPVVHTLMHLPPPGFQDPSDRRKILLDEKLRTLFRPPLTMFSMSKQLSRHVKTAGECRRALNALATVSGLTACLRLSHRHRILLLASIVQSCTRFLIDVHDSTLQSTP